MQDKYFLTKLWRTISMSKYIKVLYLLLALLTVTLSLEYILIRKNVILYLYRASDVSKNLDNEDILNNIAVVITSCDKRSVLWPIQFQALFKYWPQLKLDRSFIPIYLISNFKSYDDKRVQTITVGKDISWSDNLIQSLKKIDKRYIVLLLDDYIQIEPINEKRLIELSNLMLVNNSIHTEIAMDPVLQDGIPHKIVPHLMYRAQKGAVRTSLQAGIWQKEGLLSLLRTGENPWQFELLSNFRSFSYLKPFYLVTDDPVFKYVNLTSTFEKRQTSASRYDKTSLQELIQKGLIKSEPQPFQ